MRIFPFLLALASMTLTSCMTYNPFPTSPQSISMLAGTPTPDTSNAVLEDDSDSDDDDTSTDEDDSSVTDE